MNSTLNKLYFYKLSQEQPRPQVGETKVHQVFLKNDVLRESSGPWYQAKRGLIIYDTSTMPIHINNNFFYDFPATPDNTPVSFDHWCSQPKNNIFQWTSLNTGIELANTRNSKAMASNQCFLGWFSFSYQTHNRELRLDTKLADYRD